MARIVGPPPLLPRFTVLGRVSCQTVAAGWWGLLSCGVIVVVNGRAVTCYLG